MTRPVPPDDLIVGDRYYILASSVAGDLPKLVLKHDEAFLVADRRGDVPALPGSEFGFYVDGTRMLRQLDLRLHGGRPLLLNATLAEEGLECAIDLTNPDVLGEEHVVLPGRTLRIWRRLVLYANRLYQALSIESFARAPHDLELRWAVGADFVDVFEVRGHPRPRRGQLLPTEVRPAAVELGYRGLDGLTRRTLIEFQPAPASVDPTGARYRVRLEPGGRLELVVTVSAWTDTEPVGPPLRWDEALARRSAVVDGLRRAATRVEADHELFNAWIGRARSDLHLLLTDTPDGFVPYAGIPWFVAPFGRDSLITALQTLPFEPEIARGTLRFLARHQGRTDDAFTDQEPGKIMHELRRGELAACREIPFVPYYGTVDATPLYLMLLAEYLRWTGDLPLARELWPTAERALAWMTADGDGEPEFLRYQRRSPVGLDNQGWKDSHDAVAHVSGALAKPPIAVVEAQGYQYGALLGVAGLAEALGRPALAAALRQRAARLRARFERDFWQEDLQFYALALDGAAEPCRVISSNPGHCLWTRLVDDSRAEAVARRLMAEDMFTGWGLRTLSSRERLYNPMSYHNGSVWPHDTAIAALGLRQYGQTEAFLALATGLFQAAMHFDGLRMPELFCGFPRQPGHGPTRYPVACSPQAWSAGVVFQLVAGMLGLLPDAPANHLTLNRPRLPSWLRWLEVHGLRVGRSRVSLRASQSREGAAVELLAREGDVEVVVRR